MFIPYLLKSYEDILSNQLKDKRKRWGKGRKGKLASLRNIMIRELHAPPAGTESLFWELSPYRWGLGGFPSGADGKESACSAGDWGSIPGTGRSPGGGHGTHSSIFA